MKMVNKHWFERKSGRSQNDGRVFLPPDTVKEQPTTTTSTTSPNEESVCLAAAAAVSATNGLCNELYVRSED